MKYISTRGNSTEKKSTEAIIQGLASDKGLFIPSEIPRLPIDLSMLSELTYHQVASLVLMSFFPDFTREEIEHCVFSAYDSKFDHSNIVKIEKVGDIEVLELFHGKTAAFKDMALSILPHLMTTAIKKEKENNKICILAATSGDTGKAALEGFANVDGTEIVVFYPHNAVSKVQERQMTTQEGNNTHVIAIKGNFDTAQSGVKQIFADDKLAKELKSMNIKLSSANSINIGRLIPQVAYYIYSYGQLVKQGKINCGEKINIVVPTGNFGNILAAYYGKKMGMPFNKFICASNKNNVLTDFINTGTYSIKRDFYLTNSPSMDILISSNLERLLYHISGEDSNLISNLMNSLEKDGEYSLPKFMLNELDDFYGNFASEEETETTISKVWKDNEYLLDTHTAVAYKVYDKYKRETGDNTKTIIAGTASPFKFSDSVIKSLGYDVDEDGFKNMITVQEKTGVKIPNSLADLEKKAILHSTVINSDNMKNKIKEILS